MTGAQTLFPSVWIRPWEQTLYGVSDLKCYYTTLEYSLEHNHLLDTMVLLTAAWAVKHTSLYATNSNQHHCHTGHGNELIWTSGF